MKNAIVAIVISLFLGLSLVIVLNLNTNKNKYPPVVEVDSFEIDSILRSHSNIVAIKGTGSMQPLIPGGNPEEIVAWAIVDNSKDFSLLESGLVVVFERKNGEFIIHELSLLDKDGWISSGCYNKFYDAGRVTRDNLRGVVTLIYKLKK